MLRDCFRCCCALAIFCSLQRAQDKFTLQLNWFQLADHSPIYLAMKKGYYKEENIDLTMRARRGLGRQREEGRPEAGRPRHLRTRRP